MKDRAIVQLSHETLARLLHLPEDEIEIIDVIHRPDFGAVQVLLAGDGLNDIDGQGFNPSIGELGEVRHVQLEDVHRCNAHHGEGWMCEGCSVYVPYSVAFGNDGGEGVTLCEGCCESGKAEAKAREQGTAP